MEGTEYSIAFQKKESVTKLLLVESQLSGGDSRLDSAGVYEGKELRFSRT